MPTRDELLDAAERVIRRDGLGGATTRAIAEEAGCSEGSLYNHFGGKSDLIGEVLTERMPEFIRFMQDLPDRAGMATVGENLTSVGRLAIDFYTEIGPMIGCTIGDPVLRERHREAMRGQGRGPQRAIHALADYLAAEQRLERVRRPLDTTAVATLFLGGCFHHAFLTLGLPPEVVPQDRDVYLDGAVAALEVAVGPQEDR